MPILPVVIGVLVARKLIAIGSDAYFKRVTRRAIARALAPPTA